MQWLNELPFAENRVLQIGFLAACGIAALIVLAIVYRLAFAHRLRVPGGRTRQPRLGLVDAFSLDGQRQLVLIRRDNVEHLVMIGGPNDVLVESQINRAVAPARESNSTSPLLVPSAPARRTEAAPAAVEAPVKVAAKALASPPSPAPAAPPAPPPVPKPPAQATAPVAPQAHPPVAPQTSVPAPAQASAPAPIPAPKPIVPEPSRPAAPPLPPTQAAEPARPAPASPPPRPARSAMPPPIVPPNAAANRAAAAARAPEPTGPRGPGNPPAPSAAPSRGLERSEPAVAAKAEPAKAEPAKTEPAKTEPVTGPTVTVQAPGATLAQPRPAETAPASSGAQKTADPRAPGDKPNAGLNVKPPAKVDDPFDDLDSLEAEMARLLGREKSD